MKYIIEFPRALACRNCPHCSSKRYRDRVRGTWFKKIDTVVHTCNLKRTIVDPIQNYPRPDWCPYKQMGVDE